MYNSGKPLKTTFRGSSAVEQATVNICVSISIYMPDKRTYQDRKEALKAAVVKRRKKVKDLSLDYKGGKCQACGYSKCKGALELHHIDPKTKLFGIGEKGYTRSWAKVQLELDKCILLCANCHREVESGILQLPDESQDEKRGEFGEPLTLK